MDSASEFKGGDSTIREVMENAPAGEVVGNRVESTNLENDILIYRISGTDAGAFEVDAATGQVAVGVGASVDLRSRPAIL